MAVENSSTVIIEVDLQADDAAVQATRLGASIKQLTADNKALKQAGQQNGLQYQTNALALRNLQREQRAYTVIANGATGSLNSQRAQLSLLRQQYDALSAAERESTTAGKSLQLQIEAINRGLLQSEGATGRFQRNVGNYAGGIGSSLQQFASVTPIGGFLPTAQLATGPITAFTQAVGFATKAVKAQQVAQELQVISSNAAADSTSRQTVASEALVAAEEARIAAEAKLSEEQAARLALQEQLIAIEAGFATEQEAEIAILNQLALEQAAVNAELEVRIAQDGVLTAETAVLTTAESARAGVETELAAATAATAAASEASAAKQRALASATTLAAGVIVAAIIAAGAAVASFLSKLDSVSDGWEQFKSRASGAFSQVGSEITNLYNNNSFGDFVVKLVGGLNKIAKASSAAGKEFERFTEGLQNLEDFQVTNDYNNQVTQNEIANLRLRAKNRRLDNDDRQDLLAKADRLEREALDRTQGLHETSIQYDVEFAKRENELQLSQYDATKKLTDQDLKELRRGNLERAFALLNNDQITRDAFDRLKGAYEKRNSDTQVANQMAERIQNDQDKYAEQAKAKEEKRLAELQKINEDRLKSELYLRQQNLTARQAEFETINADIDKRVALYKRFGQSTVTLEQERQGKINALVQKFQDEDVKTTQANVRALEDIRINAITDSTLRQQAQQEAANQRSIEDTDAQILEISRRMAMGEQGLTDLQQSYIDKRNGYVQQGADQRAANEEANQQRLRDIQTRGEADAFALIQQQMQAEQEQYEQRLRVNEGLSESYQSLTNTIGGLFGKNTIAGKIAAVAQVAFGLQQIAINAAIERSQIAVRYEVLKTQAVLAASALGPLAPFVAAAAIAGLSAAESVELGAVTGKQIANSAAVIASGAAKVAFATGGIVDYHSDGRGAILRGAGNGTSDSMRANVSNGEAVINARSTSMYRGILSDINQAGGGRAFATGGLVGGTYLPTLGSNAAGTQAQINELRNAMSQIKIFAAITDIRSEDAKYVDIVQGANF